MNQSGNFPPPFRLNQWLVQPALNRISGPEGDVQIEPLVMRVLLVLAEEPGRVVTRLRLLDEVWGDTIVGEEILTRAVSELRRVFGDSARQPRYIETIRHHGYRLIVEVRPEPGEPALPERGREEPGPQPQPHQYPQQQESKNGRTPWLHIALGAAALVLLAVFVPKMMNLGSREKPSPDANNLPAAVPLTSYPGRERFPAFSPDGTRVAFAWAGPDRDNIDIYIKQRNSESTLRLTDDPGWAAWPTWSPDGQTVAYVQGTGSGSVICLVPSLGGTIRQVHDVDGWVEGLDWSPDGTRLIYSAPTTDPVSHRLFTLMIDNFEARPVDLDRPDPAGDIQPRFSPDGKTVAWIGLDQAGRNGLFVAPAGGGIATGVYGGMAALQGLAWSPDGLSLVYAAAPEGRFDLWRVAVGGGQPQWIPTPGDFAWNPTIARDTGDLVYEEVRADQDLWRIRIVGRDPWQLETEPFIKSTRWEFEADFSPDGSRVVFVSARSGKPELWLGDQDGNNLRRLTSLGAAMVSHPRWSPAGDRIAFNAVMDGQSTVMVIQARGGEPQTVDSSEGQGVFTSWCADGEHLLVSEDRGEGWQIYRQDPAGGPGVKLTTTGGLTATESPSGQELYFTRPDRPGLWRVALNESAEPELIIPNLSHQDRRNWRLVSDGNTVERIAWVMRVQGSAFLMFYDLAAGESSFLTELPGLAGSGLALASGGDEFIYARTDNIAGDLMLLEGLANFF
jgi:Tol biopolymer transport system component/DNA-binding winged helix-turn-helix (wHTH) protein